MGNYILFGIMVDWIFGRKKTDKQQQEQQ